MAKDGVLDFQSFTAQVATMALPSLLLLSGEEDYHREQVLAALRARLIPAGLEQVDALAYDWNEQHLTVDRLQSEWQTPPFMAERRLIVLKNCPYLQAGVTHKEEQEALLAALPSIPASSLVVFVLPTVDQRLKTLWKAFTAAGALRVDCPRLSGEALKSLLWREVQAAGVKISPAAAEAFLVRCRSELRLFQDELHKLLLYARAAGATQIDETMVENVCIPDLSSSIFQLTDALAAGQTARAYEILEQLLAMKEKVQGIHFMMCRQLRQLICAKEAGRPEALMQLLKVPPFVAKRLCSQARRFRMSDLLVLYRRAFEQDYRLKKGLLKEEELLDLVMLRLLYLARRH